MTLIALARNLGHTDTRMVEKHYSNLSDQYLREQVRRFAPAFGVEQADVAGADTVCRRRPERSMLRTPRRHARPRARTAGSSRAARLRSRAASGRRT
jgi:hypothetical protein